MDSFERGTTLRRRLVKIKTANKDLRLTGINVEGFLEEFELTGAEVGAEVYDLVSKVIFFVKGESLKEEVEGLSGYEERDRNALKTSMKREW